MYARPLYAISFERCKEVEYWNVCCFILLHDCFPLPPFCVSSFSYRTFSSLPSRLSARTIVGLKVWFIEVMTVSVLYCTAVRFLAPLDSFRFVSRFTHTYQDTYDYAKTRFKLMFFFLLMANCCKIFVKFINALMKFLSREFIIFLFNIVSSL